MGEVKHVHHQDAWVGRRGHRNVYTWQRPIGAHCIVRLRSCGGVSLKCTHLLCLESLQPALRALITDDNERPPILVEGETHGVCSSTPSHGQVRSARASAGKWCACVVAPYRPDAHSAASSGATAHYVLHITGSGTSLGQRLVRGSAKAFAHTSASRPYSRLAPTRHLAPSTTAGAHLALVLVCVSYLMHRSRHTALSCGVSLVTGSVGVSVVERYQRCPRAARTAPLSFWGFELRGKFIALNLSVHYFGVLKAMALCHSASRAVAVPVFARTVAGLWAGYTASSLTRGLW